MRIIFIRCTTVKWGCDRGKEYEPLFYLSYTDTVFQYLCLPHEPEFKGIHVAATLDAFIPCVIAHIIGFVLLEKVVSPQLITLF